jgi:hypothetical protein
MVDKDIVHENGSHWVHRAASRYAVFIAGATHSVSDSAYPRDADGLSLAIARCGYLARVALVKRQGIAKHEGLSSLPRGKLPAPALEA